MIFVVLYLWLGFFRAGLLWQESRAVAKSRVDLLKIQLGIVLLWPVTAFRSE